MEDTTHSELSLNRLRPLTVVVSLERFGFELCCIVDSCGVGWAVGSFSPEFGATLKVRAALSTMAKA